MIPSTDTFPTLSTGNLKKVLITKNGKTTTYTSKKKNLDGIAGGLGVFTFGDCQNYYASQSDLKKYGLDSDSRITVDITYKERGLSFQSGRRFILLIFCL